jgi:segregation and condensation protein B
MTTGSSENTQSVETPCSTLPLQQRVEALLFASERSLSEAKIKTVLGVEDEDATKQITSAINSLNNSYDDSTRAFRIERIAGGYRVMTREELAPVVSRLHAERQQQKLSQAALETLSIIAYRQPVMRAEIEVIRGVACGDVLRGLMDRRLVKIVGRAEELGRPMLYGTTKDFLNIFGLANLNDLPEVQGLVREASWKPAKPAEFSQDNSAQETSGLEDTKAESSEVAETSESVDTQEQTTE